MQTRARHQRHQQHQQLTDLPHLPAAVQVLILDKAVAQFPRPDQQEYELYPFRSSCAWLLSLQRVCSFWRQHLQTHPPLQRRVRLERLCHVWSLHHYAYYIVTRAKSKQQRIKQVPRSITLQFADGSSTLFDVPKGGVAGLTAKQRRRQGHPAQHDTTGLPTHALMLRCSCEQVSSAALVELLGDLDTLDQQQAAPIILQVERSAAAGQTTTAAPPVTAAGSEPPPDVTSQPAVLTGGALAVLEAAAAAAISSGGLVDVVKEGGCASGVLTFIPTKQGFCRRVPAG